MATDTKTSVRNGKPDTVPTDATNPAGTTPVSLEAQLDAQFLKAKNRKPSMRAKVGDKTYSARGTVGVKAYTQEAVVEAARNGIKTSVSFLGGKVRDGGDQSGDDAAETTALLLSVS